MTELITFLAICVVSLALLAVLIFGWHMLRPTEDDGYVYGHIGNLCKARRNNRTGEVQSLEFGLSGPVWVRSDGWEDTFSADPTCLHRSLSADTKVVRQG